MSCSSTACSSWPTVPPTAVPRGSRGHLSVPSCSPCPGSSGRLSGGLSRTHRDRVGPVPRYRDPSPERRHPVGPPPVRAGPAAVTSRGAPQRTWHRPWLRRSRAPAPPLPLWRPARRRRGDRGWRRCGAAPCVRSPDGRPRGSAGCRVRAGTRCRGSHPPRPGAGCPGGSGGGLVSAWASAGSTVTIVGTTKAPVPATAAFRMKSRRPVAPPGFGGLASSVELAIRRLLGRLIGGTRAVRLEIALSVPALPVVVDAAKEEG
jgi:hypothetical protein